MEQLIKIADFILQSFIHIWPYLLITIPLAVLVNLTGASRFINKALSKNPLLSVLLATVVGAFSPFCSCGVIPVISSLLIGGVPLAPVMSFWIASPSMDPEIFFLSSSVLGWDLAVWRLSATFLISLLAGYITHYAALRGFFKDGILRTEAVKEKGNIFSFIKSVKLLFTGNAKVKLNVIRTEKERALEVCCSVAGYSPENEKSVTVKTENNSCDCNKNLNEIHQPFGKKLLNETFRASWMVSKFMAIAFFIGALIKFYLPEEVISGMLQGSSNNQVIIATLTGIPLYTSNITALPLVGSLLSLGLNKGAALAFLIAGSTTTLPAMVAVWGIAKTRVFILYLLFAVLGALFSGLIFNLFAS